MRRIRTDLMFQEASEGDEVWQALKNYLRTKKIRRLVNEKSFIEYEECGHDSTPPKPCVVIERREV